jgi:hypothetical protein
MGSEGNFPVTEMTISPIATTPAAISQYRSPLYPENSFTMLLLSDNATNHRNHHEQG